MTGSHDERTVTIFTGGQRSSSRELTPIEAQARLSVNGQEWLIFHCTPESLQELAVGYLFNEGVLAAASEVQTVQVNSQNHIDCWLGHAVERPERWQRTSGCQGGMLLSDIPVSNMPGKAMYFLKDLYELIRVFHHSLSKKDPRLRGMHSTCLFDQSTPLIRYNDIGRHNTLDKIAGWMLTGNHELFKPSIITTGRLTAEMVSKCARMKIPVVLSFHTATSAAIELAEAIGVCLVGHARLDRIEIYSHQELISE